MKQGFNIPRKRMSDMIKYSMLVLDMRRTETSQNVRKNACMVQIFNILNSLDLAIFNPYHDWGPLPPQLFYLKNGFHYVQGRTRAFVQGGGHKLRASGRKIKILCPPPLWQHCDPFYKPLFEKNVDTFFNFVQVNYSITR